MIVVKRLIHDWSSWHTTLKNTKITCLIDNFSWSHIKLSSKSLFLPHFFLQQPLFLCLLFPRFFFHLGLQSLLHFKLLLFSFWSQYIFLVPSLEYRAFAFELDVHSIFSDFASCFEVREISFRLHRTIQLLLWSGGLVNVLLWDVVLNLHCFYRTRLLFGIAIWESFIWIKSKRG